MDRPFSFLLDVYYNWGLETTKPIELAADRFEYIPKYWSLIIGKYWTLYWYRDLALETGLSAKEELATVKPSKMIPASYHVYNDEFESVRKALEGAVALKRNSVKSQGYKELFEIERGCLERLSQTSDTTPSNYYDAQEQDCRLPKQLYFKDVDQTLDEWRTNTLECLTKHSAEYGDGNKQAFNECTENYAQILIDKGTNAEYLDKWGRHFMSLFVPGAIKKFRVD